MIKKLYLVQVVLLLSLFLIPFFLLMQKREQI